MAPHSSTLAWKIPWTEEPARLQSMRSLRKQLHFHFSLPCIGGGNGNPLQCSCLENLRDGEAWWAAIYGVTQSRTWLKRLSSSSSKRLELIMLLLSHFSRVRLCAPHRWQPIRLPSPWDSPGKNTWVGCHLLTTKIEIEYLCNIIEVLIIIKMTTLL